MPNPNLTAAHVQTLALSETLRLWFPEHEPRTADPAYRLFDQAKRRMRKLAIPCWRCGVAYPALNRKPGGAASPENPLGACQLEAHHADLEFSLQNGVDVERWWTASRHWDSTPDQGAFMVQAFSQVDGWLQKHPDYAQAPAETEGHWHERVFRAYIESEGNLMQLCDVCHRSTHQGIHHIPYPEWRALAVWRQGLPAHIT